MKYQVMWKYSSSLGGPWMKGDFIDVDPGIAEAINRDSPGVLKKTGAANPILDEKKRKDRMVKEAETRGRGKGKGPITKADFKAVKD